MEAERWPELGCEHREVRRKEGSVQKALGSLQAGGEAAPYFPLETLSDDCAFQGTAVL